MNKKNLIYLVVLVVLLGVAGWLISQRNNTGTIERTANYEFTIKDTASITKIVLEDKTPEKVVLTRTENGWVVNGESPARKDAIEVLLMTLNRMEMRNFIPERMQETVIKRMSVFGKEVQVYQNGELAKHFFVGTEAQDEMATYMMIKGSDQPFAVYIPGFNGFLSTRFFTSPHLWRSRDVTRMDPRNIREVRLQYPDSAAASFAIRVLSPDSFMIRNLRDNQVMANADKMKTRLFLSALGNVKYEGAIIPTDPIWQRRDSLLASMPVFSLDIQDADGDVVNLKGYRIKGQPQTFDPELPASEFDPDRMHGFINEEEMVLLQYEGLGKVLRSIEFFKG